MKQNPILDAIVFVVTALGGMAFLYGVFIALIKKRRSDKKDLKELQEAFNIITSKLKVLEDKTIITKQDIEQLEADYQYLIRLILERQIK